MDDTKFSALRSIIGTVDILKKKKSTNIVNVNSNNTPPKSTSRYALHEDYEPRTDVASAAYEISGELNDRDNFALHFAIVKRIGPAEAYRLLHETLDDVKSALNNGNPIRNKAALFNWKFGQLVRHAKKL
jgi:hypothetical protein